MGLTKMINDVLYLTLYVAILVGAIYYARTRKKPPEKSAIPFKRARNPEIVNHNEW
jgi:hypothetical protein